MHRSKTNIKGALIYSDRRMNREPCVWNDIRKNRRPTTTTIYPYFIVINSTRNCIIILIRTLHVLKLENSGKKWPIAWLLMSAMSGNSIAGKQWTDLHFYHDRVFKLPMLSQCWEVTEHVNVWFLRKKSAPQGLIQSLVARLCQPMNSWKRMCAYTQHCSYWWSNAKAPCHHSTQCWLNIQCIVTVSYRNTKFIGTTQKANLQFNQNTRLFMG